MRCEEKRFRTYRCDEPFGSDPARADVRHASTKPSSRDSSRSVNPGALNPAQRSGAFRRFGAWHRGTSFRRTVGQPNGTVFAAANWI